MTKCSYRYTDKNRPSNDNKTKYLLVKTSLKLNNDIVPRVLFRCISHSKGSPEEVM